MNTIIKDISEWAMTSGAGYCRRYRIGVVQLFGSVSASVTFSEPLSSGDFTVFFERSDGKPAFLWPSGKSASGFVLNSSVPLSEAIRYVAFES